MTVFATAPLLTDFHVMKAEDDVPGPSLGVIHGLWGLYRDIEGKGENGSYYLSYSLNSKHPL